MKMKIRKIGFSMEWFTADFFYNVLARLSRFFLRIADWELAIKYQSILGTWNSGNFLLL